MLNKVIDIVKEASKLMFVDISSIEEKGEITNIVTSQDLQVQEYLVSHLQELLPDSSFFCEEEGLKDFSKDYVWIIDPIDGTTNFARRMPVCAISVALTYKKEIILGVVYNAFGNELFSAEKGKGSYLNGKRLSVSTQPFNKCIMGTAFSAYDKNLTHICVDILTEIFPQINDVRRMGSAACELCYIAAGRTDLFFEINLNPWDYAAATLILNEAGGIISGNERYNLPLNHSTPVFAANNKENYDRLYDIVIKHL